MSAQVIELVSSREITNTSSTYRYVVTGATDEENAASVMLSTAPTFDRSLLRTGYSIVPEGAGVYSGRVEYGIFSNEPGQQTVTVEITGQNVHITHSRNTTSYAPSGETAPDFKGAIGVSKGGKEIAGVDIQVPVMSITVTRTVAPSDANSIISASKSLFSRVNSSSFTVSGLTFDTGEVLYGGSRSSQRGNEVWDFSHSFQVLPNESGLTIGDITVSTKNGWQYLWTYYGVTDDSGSNSLVSKPLAAYVEDVYLQGDFSALGLT